MEIHCLCQWERDASGQQYGLTITRFTTATAVIFVWRQSSLTEEHIHEYAEVEVGRLVSE